MEPRRRPVDQGFLERIDSDLEYLEDHGAPPLVWRILGAVAREAAAEVAWQNELKAQEFRE